MYLISKNETDIYNFEHITELYVSNMDGSSPIIRKMEEYFSRSGEKVKLKKRIDELEKENALLRSLLQK